MAEDGDFVPLTHAILCECLSQIEQAVGEGGLAFTRLDCSGKELTDLGNKVESYKQLRHVTLSQNRLTDISKVTQLPHLLSLQADQNEVASLECMKEASMPWCQKLDLSNNKLTSLASLVSLDRLRFASFKGNQIASLEGFAGHPTLEELELQGNVLTTLVGMGTLASCKRLDLSECNTLESLEGLDAPCLAYLNLRSNKLAKLEFIGGAPALNELDISENQLSAEDPKLPELRRLCTETPKLRKLLLSGNSVGKTEALVCVPRLTEVDGEEVTLEDREAAKEREDELAEQIRQAEEEAAAAAEEARIAAEEEAAAAAAAAAEAAEAEEGGG